MIEVGERAPGARVWLGANESVSLAELVAEGPILLLFYLYDWSST